MTTRKLFIWEDPYDVSWGTSLLVVMAESLEEAKHYALLQWKENKGRDYGGELPEPTMVADAPYASWHEWSE